ncbi:DUF1254 domain-containing protein [Kitasatospora sp. A2-31]|uniref:DUF1254 domain-containing protein n=1 Tax=Kitasatospora sp. A2-31 TaxID=2916414 RepID=UPI001EEC19A8|nr:DUF1254 domain-containing protein [Kitasatospora sp. A2-31]MCG6497213.1 DUF1214 domain-containing protein [Kitasatospora sp. A2-31]
MVNPALVDPATIRATAAEAWVRGYPVLRNYRTLYAQAVDDADPKYAGGFGVFRHEQRQPFARVDGDLVAPDVLAPDVLAPDVLAPEDDMPCSWAWLDLRTEPWVVSVPAEDRYYVLPVHELDTVYAGFIGARTTGQEAGDHLVAGPGWRGEVPAGITSVIRTATELVGIVGRTHLADASPAAVSELRALQQQYRLRPLHEYAGTPAPEPAPHPIWPVWRDEVLDTIEFFSFLDFLLGFFPVLPAEADLRGRLTDLGVDGRGEFEPAALPIQVRAEIERGIADGRAELERAAERTADSSGLFGTREQIGTAYLKQAVGAMKGLYGLPEGEAWYGGWTVDSEGNGPPNASDRDYVLRFAPDRLPPARFLWSVTMYGLPERRLVDNTLDRYAIGDRTPGLVHDPDGGLTLYLQHKRPADAQHSANWLPAPDGPFTPVLRLYGPDAQVLDGRWTPPPLTPR